MSRELKGEHNPIHRAADKIGTAASTNATTNPSVLSSAGAIGRQFNPDGNIGQIPQKIGGPFSKDGIIGSQFDASKGGIAGTVERAVDGPSQHATAHHRQLGPEPSRCEPGVRSNSGIHTRPGRKSEVP